MPQLRRATSQHPTPDGPIAWTITTSYLDSFTTSSLKNPYMQFSPLVNCSAHCEVHGCLHEEPVHALSRRGQAQMAREWPGPPDGQLDDIQSPQRPQPRRESTASSQSPRRVSATKVHRMSLSVELRCFQEPTQATAGGIPDESLSGHWKFDSSVLLESAHKMALYV